MFPREASQPSKLSGFLMGSGNLHPDLIDLYYATPSVVWSTSFPYVAYSNSCAPLSPMPTVCHSSTTSRGVHCFSRKSYAGRLRRTAGRLTGCRFRPTCPTSLWSARIRTIPSYAQELVACIQSFWLNATISSSPRAGAPSVRCPRLWGWLGHKGTDFSLLRFSCPGELHWCASVNPGSSTRERKLEA